MCGEGRKVLVVVCDDTSVCMDGWVGVGLVSRASLKATACIFVCISVTAAFHTVQAQGKWLNVNSVRLSTQTLSLPPLFL